MPVCLGGVIRRLRAEGVTITPAMVHHAISSGKVAEPAKLAGRFIFDDANVAELRTYATRDRKRPSDAVAMA